MTSAMVKVENGPAITMTVDIGRGTFIVDTFHAIEKPHKVNVLARGLGTGSVAANETAKRYNGMSLSNSTEGKGIIAIAAPLT